jgi:hypothetical protein
MDDTEKLSIRKDWKLLLWSGVGALLMLVAMIAFMQWQPEKKTAPEKTSPRQEQPPVRREIAVGQMAVLSYGDSSCVPVAFSEDAWHQLQEAAAAHDQVGLKQLQDDWQAACLPAGTKVLLLDNGWAGAKVRIKSGALMDTVAWCSIAEIR